MSKPPTSVYGSIVLAELPQGLLNRAPNESRNIEAMYLHAGLGTGPVVQGFVREEGQMTLRRFVARNLKPIFPIAWKTELAGDLLLKIDSPAGPPPPLPDVPMGHEDVSEHGPIQGEVRGGSPDQGSPGSGIVEYPDGAPPAVIRAMQAPETHDFEFKRGSVKRNQTEVPTVSNRPMTMRRQGPIRALTPVGSPDTNVEGFGRTDGCPACQSCEALQTLRTQIQNQQPRSAERSKGLYNTNHHEKSQFQVSSNGFAFRTQTKWKVGLLECYF